MISADIQLIVDWLRHRPQVMLSKLPALASLAIFFELLGVVKPIPFRCQAKFLEGFGIPLISSLVLSAKVLAALTAREQRCEGRYQSNAFHPGWRI